MHWTEQEIRRVLDGTFTRAIGDRVVTRKVDLDFIPTFDPPKPQKQASLGKGVIRKPWTSEQDERLLALRKAGVTLNACTQHLRRGIKQVRARLKQLEDGVTA